MQAPALPANESARVQALQRCTILDTAPEERFDRLTRLAQTLFGTRMALVSLVDADRQWFKSRQGLDASETPRDISFCGHAILGEDIFEVSDARSDPRFADNPLVSGPPHIRFYAGAPLESADGHRIGTLCIIDPAPRTLTARERSMLLDLAAGVEEEIRRIDLIRQADTLRLLLGNLPGAAYRCANDEHWTMHFISDYVQVLTGYPAADFLQKQGGNRTFASLIHPDDAPRVNATVQADLANQRGFRVQYRILHADGQLRWMQELGRGVFDTDGKLLYLNGFIWDVTETRRLEQMKSEFISTVSHELRTPLTSISAALGLITGGLLGALPAPAAEMIQIAHRNSQRLTLLINDLLDMEKLEAGKMPFDLRPHRLQPLVEEAIDAQRAAARARQVHLHLIDPQPGLTVSADSQRLMQVLSNLLSNAIKFSPAGSRVAIRLSRQDGLARLAITDQGPGIPPAFRARIFQKFAQADASDSRPKGGTGLGLAICHELMQRMGGQIGFDSPEGQGATFHIDLPLTTDTP